MAEAELNPAAPAVVAAPPVAAAEGDEPPPKKSKLPLIIAIVVVLVLIGGGVGGWMWYSAKKKKEAEEAEQTLESRLKAQMQFKKENKAPTFVKMDPFTVNLPSKGGNTTFRLRCSCAFLKARSKEKSRSSCRSYKTESSRFCPRARWSSWQPLKERKF